jgi:tetratricopeptide (TPR) repeat protein
MTLPEAIQLISVTRGFGKVRFFSTATTQLRMVDWAALVLLAFEIPSLFFSQVRANSARASEVVAIAVVVYFLLRLLLRTPLGSAWLAALLGLCGAWLGISSILQFKMGTEQLSAVGLTDFIAFRSRFIHPISGWVPGECFTVLLLTLPFACAAAAYIWRIGSAKGRFGWAILAFVPAAPIIGALLLSLSRAVFWSTILFFLMAWGLMTAYRVVTLRTASLLLAGTLGVLLLLLGCETALYPGIFKAYAGGHTSQTRSTEGRIGIWSRSLELTRDHRLWGVGSSNAALSLLSSADQEETTGFASRAFSLPIQVLAEKGVLGFTLYSVFLLLASWEFHRGMNSRVPQTTGTTKIIANARKSAGRNNNEERTRLRSEDAHRAMKCCFAAGLAAVLLREITYSSLLEHTLTLVLAFALVALMCAPSRLNEFKIRPVVIAIAVVVLILQWPFLRYNQADAKLSEYYLQVASAKFSAARENIDEAIRLWPSNGRYYGWRAYIESQQLPSQCSEQSKYDNAGMSVEQQAQAREAAGDYRHALKLNDRDAVAHHNLAWLEHLLGDNASAEEDWRESIQIDPDNAAFHLSYGMFLEENGATRAAKEQYESAIELTPTILDSPFFTRYRNRLPQEADSVVKESIAKIESRLGEGKDPILEARLGKLFLYEGNLDRSKEYLERAAQQLPNLPLVWFNLGEVYEAQGNEAQALLCYQRARAIDSSLAGPYLRMGEIDLRNGQKDSAVRDLNMTVQQWQRVNPITAAHNNRLYTGPRQVIDDLLPTTLVWFISPCESSEAWSALSGLFPEKPEYSRRTRTCEVIPSPHLRLQ